MSDSELHETGRKKDDDPSTDDHGGLPSDYKVLGHNTTATGESYGVVGHADATDGWGLYTPDDAKIDGTLEANYVNTDDADFEVDAGEDGEGRGSNIVMGANGNGGLAAGMVISGGGFDDGTTSEPNIAGGRFPTIGGGRNNSIGTLTGNWGTISGGRDNSIAPDSNETHYATIGGGENNTVSGNTTHGTVAGGTRNEVSASGGAVGGGDGNVATANYSTVAGGFSNEANGSFSFAVGRNAVAGGQYSVAIGNNAPAPNDGQVVLTDSNSGQPDTSTANRLIGSFDGGYRFETTSDDNLSGVYMQNGDGSWSTLSDPATKTNVSEVDSNSVMQDLKNIDVKRWSYKWQTDVEHIGPMAGDLYEQFGVGRDDEGIQTIDADGVLFAAVKGLLDRVEELESKVDQLQG